MTAIEWTDVTWNPIRGCTRVSEGCRNCYAERTALRFSKGPYRGLVKSTSAGPRWTGNIRFVRDMLRAPLSWREPRRVFVNSMSDLFHERVDEWVLDEIFAVMALAPRHTFQILTKRPRVMREYFRDMRYRLSRIFRQAITLGKLDANAVASRLDDPRPLDNVWLGASIEDQPNADLRIPDLLCTPAAIRFVSYEPALGPVDFTSVVYSGLVAVNTLTKPVTVGVPIPHEPDEQGRRGLDWVIVGGESGPGARPFDLAWARSTVAQCRAAGVPVFVKQLGSRPTTEQRTRPAGESPWVLLRHPKGGNPAEWPEDLRVREWPKAVTR